MRSTFGCLLLMLPGVLSAEIRFVGVAKFGGSSEIALQETERGSAAWIGVGDTFMGYTLVELAKDDTIATMSYEGRVSQLRLQDAKITATADISSLSEQEFRDSVNALMIDSISRKRAPSAEEFVELALRSGRVVLKRETLESRDSIVLGLPGSHVPGDDSKPLFKLARPPTPTQRGVSIIIQ